ncbi:MAG TPA: ParB/RepB/Spo0J family partition protein [Mycobacteriales bacterium]|nr:ParB/RepB/Spo0J family partition protein [Mycobacteriales bacterium]
MTASTTTTRPAFVELDPRSLAAHPGNIRDDLGDLTELTASIKAVGVLEPVIITPVVTDDENKSAKTRAAYRILAGHRRVAAAIKAKAATVPCIVRVDLDSDIDSLTTMIVENVHRADLSATEEAAAYAQLAAFDLTPAQIAERTGRKTKTVRDALKLHRLPDSVRQPVADGSITLEQAAEIAKFADDEKAHARLMKAAESGYGLSYAIAEEKHRRDRSARKARSKAALVKAGVKVIGKPKGYPYDGPAAPVGNLCLADGATRYTVETHADCPAHAAFLDTGTGEPIYVCTDPDGNGHVRMTATRHVGPEEAARREAEEAAQAERTEALMVAAQVRGEFLRTLIATAKQPPTITATSLLVLFGYADDMARNHAHLVADLLGIDPDTASIGGAYAERIRTVTPAKTCQHVTAHAAAIAETNLARLAAGRTWGYRPALTVTWFDLLESHGYQPSEIERVVRDEAVRDRDAEEAELAAEDEEDGPEAADDADDAQPEID